MRGFTIFFILVLMPLNALDMPPVYEISSESSALQKVLRRKAKIDAILSKVEEIYSQLYAQSNTEIDQFFEKAKVGCDDFATEVSGYCRDTLENKKAIESSYRKYVMSESEFSVLQNNLNNKINAKFKMQLEQIFADYDIFETDEPFLKKPGYVSSSVNHDNSYMDKNKVAWFFWFGEKCMEFRLNIRDSMIYELFSKYLPWNSYSAKDEIKSNILTQLETQKHTLKEEINNMIKENLHKICEILREKLEIHFSKVQEEE